MRCIDLFAGAGGAALGSRRVGVRHVACVDNWQPAVDCLLANGFPGVLADVDEWRPAARPDLVWASPPCQSFSQAGTGSAGADERNGYPALFSFLRDVRPTWLASENVRGLTHHSASKCETVECGACYLAGWILPALRDLFPSVQSVVLNAADFGLPQTRRRLIIVAGPRPIRWPHRTHAPRSQVPGLFGDLLPWVGMSDVLGVVDDDPRGNRPGGQPARTVSTRGNAMVRPKNAGMNERCPRATPVREPDEPSFTIRARPDLMWMESASRTGARRERTLDEPSFTVTSTTSGTTRVWQESGSVGRNRTARGHAAVRDVSSPSYTIVTSDNYVATETRRRCLTVEECAALQGFPPYYIPPGRAEDRHRLVGNAVPPILAEVVVRRIVEAATRS